MFFIVCPMVFLASFVDAVAGGGGLISLPAYLLAGVPMHNAIATNKLSSASGTILSTWRLCKNGYVDWGLALPGGIMAVAGSVIGARLALLASDKILQLVLILILPIVAFYVLRKKELDTQKRPILSRKMQFLVVAIASFLIGGYDGFYGPGTGTFLLLIYTGLAKMDSRKASGNMKVANLSSNVAALTVFLMNGKILIPLGLAASIFSIGGHYLGSGMVMKSGSKIIRPVILAVIGLLFIKVFFGFIENNFIL